MSRGKLLVYTAGVFLLGALSAAPLWWNLAIPDDQLRTVDMSAQQEARLNERAVELDQWEQDLEAREAELEAQEEIRAKSTITDGVWTVGLDVAPGTYRSDGAGQLCYWEITESGTNSLDLVMNGAPTGGHPSVTLEEGMDFETDGCGDWRKR